MNHSPALIKKTCVVLTDCRAIGGRVDQFGNDKDLARKVGVDYTLAGARAMCTSLSADTLASTGRKFRFVFCSGMLAEWDQSRKLLFLEDTRKIKGSIEKALCELADNNSETFELWIARPSALLGSDAGLHKKLFGPLYRAIGTEQLGRAMIRMAIDGWKERTAGNEELLKM